MYSNSHDEQRGPCLGCRARGSGPGLAGRVVGTDGRAEREDISYNRPDFRATTTNKQLKNAVVYKDQVTVTMQKVGDQWLIDDLVTSPAG